MMHQMRSRVSLSPQGSVEYKGRFFVLLITQNRSVSALFPHVSKTPKLPPAWNGSRPLGQQKVLRMAAALSRPEEPAIP
jgi:hypothetical protein